MGWYRMTPSGSGGGDSEDYRFMVKNSNWLQYICSGMELVDSTIIINNVKTEDQSRFFCSSAIRNTNIIIKNSTSPTNIYNIFGQCSNLSISQFDVNPDFQDNITNAQLAFVNTLNLNFEINFQKMKNLFNANSMFLNTSYNNYINFINLKNLYDISYLLKTVPSLAMFNQPINFFGCNNLGQGAAFLSNQVNFNSTIDFYRGEDNIQNFVITNFLDNCFSFNQPLNFYKCFAKPIFGGFTLSTTSKLYNYTQNNQNIYIKDSGIALFDSFLDSHAIASNYFRNFPYRATIFIENGNFNFCSKYFNNTQAMLNTSFNIVFKNLYNCTGQIFSVHPNSKLLTIGRGPLNSVEYDNVTTGQGFLIVHPQNTSTNSNGIYGVPINNLIIKNYELFDMNHFMRNQKTSVSGNPLNNNFFQNGFGNLYFINVNNFNMTNSDFGRVDNLYYDNCNKISMYNIRLTYKAGGHTHHVYFNNIKSAPSAFYSIGSNDTVSNKIYHFDTENIIDGSSLFMNKNFYYIKLRNRNNEKTFNFHLAESLYSAFNNILLNTSDRNDFYINILNCKNLQRIDYLSYNTNSFQFKPENNNVLIFPDNIANYYGAFYNSQSFDILNHFETIVISSAARDLRSAFGGYTLTNKKVYNSFNIYFNNGGYNVNLIDSSWLPPFSKTNKVTIKIYCQAPLQEKQSLPNLQAETNYYYSTDNNSQNVYFYYGNYYNDFNYLN